MWAIVPAAGAGSRIQPLAFSKELLPVGSAREGGIERPRAVSEYLVERMVRAGARTLCFVISPGKSDIVEYYGAGTDDARVFYVVQPHPAGLCDAVFRALPLVADAEHALVGLPDTVWFPADGLSNLGDDDLSLLCFPVARPELFDAVVSDERGAVREIRVKSAEPRSRWIWGAFKVRGRALRELHALWIERARAYVYMGTLINAWLARGGRAVAVRRGRDYVDTGTMHGYRAAIRLLRATARRERDEGRAEGDAPRVANGPRASAPWGAALPEARP